MSHVIIQGAYILSHYKYITMTYVSVHVNHFLYIGNCDTLKRDLSMGVD